MISAMRQIAREEIAFVRIADGLKRAQRHRHVRRCLRWAAALTSAFALAMVFAK